MLFQVDLQVCPASEHSTFNQSSKVPISLIVYLLIFLQLIQHTPQRSDSVNPSFLPGHDRIFCTLLFSRSFLMLHEFPCLMCFCRNSSDNILLDEFPYVCSSY